MAAPMLLDNIHVQWRFGAGGRFFLFGALLTVCLISPTETLEVTMFANPKSVLVNEDISLECKFFGFNPAAFNLKKVGIQWLGPNNQEIYVFNGGAATSKRIGAKMSTDALQKGDASLHLPKIQLTEEREYTCIVFITPEKAEEKSTLEVSARPVISLSREHIKILIGSEGTLSCNVTGFYPERHGLIWQKISNKGSKEPKNLTDVCSRAVTPNNDGTFSVSSKITIVPTLDDDGDVYRCFVTHRSVRPDGISQESTLRVIETSEPEENLAVNILLFLFVSLCMLLGAILCWYKFRGVPPEITCKPPIMYHLEETIVSYQILRFKPRNIAIYLFVKRREDKKEEKIFEWHSQEHRTSSAPRDTTYKVQPLINGNEEDPSFQQLQPVFYDNGDGTFKVQGSIKMYPDVFRDNEAELIFHVQHKTFAQPAVKSVTLDVRGVPPKVSDVVAPLQAHHNEPVALTCSVNGFKPRPLMIQWQQVRMDGGLKKIVHLDQDNRTIFDADDGMIHKYKHQINEIKYKDESYGITSILIITPDVLEDQLTKYICEVQHRCTNSVAMKEITLHITAPPKLDKITCAEEIIAEKPMTLSCRIHSFYPKNIKVTWLKSGEAMTQGSEKPTMGHDGLYYLTSSVKSVPTRADVGKTYTCRVEHESLKEPLEDSWVLDQLGIPSVEDIKFDPPEAVYGSGLVLSCSISNFYPQTIETAWHNKQGQIVKGITIKGPVKDERGCFRLTSHLQIKPTAQDFNGVFYFHVNHVQLKAPIVKQTSLTLPAHSPTLSSIEADPPVPEANQLVTFSISLKSYAPEVVQVKWFKNGKPCSGQVSNPCPVIANDGLFSSVTSIKFKANENDHESLIRCEVIHIETKEIREKIFKLLLKGVDSEDAAYENLGNDEGRATNYL